MATQSLYKLTDSILEAERELLDIYDQVEELGGELTPELEERLTAVNERLDQVSGDRKVKIDGIVGVYRNALMWQERLESEALTLQSRARTHAKTAERLKAYLLDDMRRHGEKRIETLHVDVRRQLNTQPSVRLLDGTVPDWCVRIKPEERQLDSKTVLANLRDAGLMPTEPGTMELDVAGARFKVTLNEHLRIR